MLIDGIEGIQSVKTVIPILAFNKSRLGSRTQKQ